MEKVQIKFKKLHPEAVIPKYATEGSAGFDFYAVIEEEASANAVIGISDTIAGERGQWVYRDHVTVIRTGLAVAIPRGYEIQVRPRSGLAFKHGITVVNTPGTIDSDYRGEIKVILTSVAQAGVLIRHGERIAQGVLAPVPLADIVEVDDLDKTERGEGGFGSTGNK